MIRVQGPDGKVTAFPADTPPEMIDQVMSEAYGGPKTPVTPFVDQLAATGDAGQMAANVNTAVVDGFAGIASTPRALYDFGNTVTRGLADLLVPGKTSPEVDAMRQQSDLVQQFLPDYETIRSALGNTDVLGKFAFPEREAETRLGRTVQEGVEFVAGNPSRSALRNVISALSGGASNEAGESAQALAGEDAGNIARIGTALLTQGGLEGLGARTTNSGSTLKRTLGGVTEQEFTQAKDLMKQARELGVPLSAAEALPQGAMTVVASNVAATTEGSAAFNRFLKDRPQQVQQVLKANIKNISDFDNPVEALAQGQKAAEQIMKEAETFRTAQVKEFFDYGGKKLPEDKAESLINELVLTIKNTNQGSNKRAALESLKTMLLETADPPVGGQRQRLNQAIQSSKRGSDKRAALEALDGVVPEEAAKPVQDLGRLHDALKEVRQRVRTESFGADPINKDTEKALTPILNRLKDVIAGQHAPFLKGNKIYEEITDQVVDPLRRGITGKLAEGDASYLFDPAVARPTQIRDSYRKLNQKNPEAFPNLVRQYLDSKLDKAFQDNISGTPATVGAKFRKAVFGTPQQRENMQAIFTGIEKAKGLPGGTIRGGFENSLKVLEKTGVSFGGGSPTQPRQQMRQDAGQSFLASILEGDITRPGAGLGKARREAKADQFTRQLIEVFTDPSPEAIDKIRTLAVTGPSSDKARLALGQLLTLSRETQQMESP